MRKAQAKKLPLAPDPKYKDRMVTRFVNCLMIGGNKSIVLTAFYNALDKVTQTTSEEGYEVWKRALVNVTPGVEVKSRRIGGCYIPDSYGSTARPQDIAKHEMAHPLQPRAQR